MDDWAETDLAWELIEMAHPLLSDRDRAELFIAIGAGSSFQAIDALLETIVREGLPVPAKLLVRLVDWLSVYAHHDDAPRLHELFNAIRAGLWTDVSPADESL